jgi:hypothetical protein
MDELARGLVAQGQDTRVLTRGRKPAARAHDASYPAPVTRLPGHGWLAHHRRYLRLYSPWLGPRLEGRVLHAATYGVAAPLLGLVARRGVRLCVYVHGLELVAARGTPEAAVLAEVLHAAPVVIANSGRVAELAVGAGAERARVHVVVCWFSLNATSGCWDEDSARAQPGCILPTAEIGRPRGLGKARNGPRSQCSSSVAEVVDGQATSASASPARDAPMVLRRVRRRSRAACSLSSRTFQMSGPRPAAWSAGVM